MHRLSNDFPWKYFNTAICGFIFVITLKQQATVLYLSYIWKLTEEKFLSGRFHHIGILFFLQFVVIVKKGILLLCNLGFSNYSLVNPSQGIPFYCYGIKSLAADLLGYQQ